MRWLTFIFVLPLLCQSQIYRKMNLDTNHYWRQVTGQSMQAQGCSVTYQIKPVRYAVFNGKSYSVIKKFGYQFTVSSWPLPYPNWCQVGNVQFFLRQDTLLKKAWMYDSIQNKETLLYDFSQNIGDSAKHVLYLPSNPPSYAKVLNIDSVLLSDGYYHRRITYTVMPSGTGFAWSHAIEGVGYDGGLFEPAWAYGGSYPGLRILLCHGKIITYPNNTQSIFADNNDVTNCNILITGVTEHERLKNIAISPNPATDEITLSAADFGIHRISILNALGEVVCSQEQAFPEGEAKMKVKDLPAGIYFARVRLENSQEVIKKFLIAR